MKILELRFKNLNSLYGEWFIDFTSPEYGLNGIFALTGPTGAGKSTILDAICLSLYGTTPRLGKITKNNNEIMSRQTGECYSEVTFESQAGKFRCHWSQHRARKKPGGNLIESRHEIANAENGEILESRKRDVAKLIEEKTGMDFDRFTRSMLLAQGGFDTFLKANIEDKSKILEQITGTEIYTEISKNVHERYSIERERLNLLKAETSGIEILTREKEKEIHDELVKNQKTESETILKLKKTEKIILWLAGIKELEKEISFLSEEIIKLNIEIKAFEPEQKRLVLAQKAVNIEGKYSQLTSLRKQQDDDNKALNIEKAKLPEISKTLLQKENQLKNSELLTIKAHEKQKILAPVIQKVRILDQQIADRKKIIDAEKNDYKKVKNQIEYDNIKIKQIKSKVKAIKKDFNIVMNYLKANAKDELLVSRLAGIEEQLNTMLIVDKDIFKEKNLLKIYEKQLKSAEKNLASNIESFTACKEKLNNAKKQTELKKEELNKILGKFLLREYRREKDTLMREMAFLKKITNLESERNKLEDGRPCPLCGSKEHPYAKGNVPEMDKTVQRINELTKLIKKAEILENNIKKSEGIEKNTLAKLSIIEKDKIKAENNRENAIKALSDISERLDKSKKYFTGLKQAALIKLMPHGIDEIPDSDVKFLISSLKKRLNKWQSMQRKKEILEKQNFEQESELKKLQAIVETMELNLIEKSNTLNALQKEYNEQIIKRNNIFGDKNPESEELRMKKEVSSAERREKSIQDDFYKIKQKKNSINTRIDSLTKQISQRILELKTLENEFNSALSCAGFSNEQSFLDNRLSVSERENLTARAKKLNDKKTGLYERKKDRENRLSLEKDKKFCDLQIEDIKPLRTELEIALKMIRDDIAGLNHQLNENNTAKEKIKEKKILIDAQQKEFSRWEKLHALIGSADGKKYRNFAQGLTFELMVSHANHQLEKMTDRYLLIRDKNNPIELNVVDNYQAGEIRSTKNLSGGESFIVSLTLALGLSKMASRKVRVDSLFLDEGFATLDDEALETALETLAGLHQDGKLIGMISHVSALKERICTQIDIVPVPGGGGKSIIKGPGCKQLV